MKKTRIAFFADLHIRDNKMQSQTDFGGPSKWIPREARKALNDINPDYIFGLGDLTATGHRKDWLGYQKWLQGLEAPVFDVVGNHDRDYTVFHDYNYGEGYFSVLGRVSATKVVKIGNLIFILVSEEHDPEGNKRLLTSTVPLKTFAFIQSILQRYSENNNIFVLSHTLLRGTTALSNDWSFNDIEDWKVISKRFFKLFRTYPVVAHLTGHTHIDYRYRSKLKDIGEKEYKEKVGKFIDGRDYVGLPEIYFLNMPCVDTAHGWLGSSFALLRRLGGKTAKAKRSPLRQLYIKLEDKGPRVFDFLYKSKVNNILGRPAVYYFDIMPDNRKVKIITRWVGKNKDVEEYDVALKLPARLSGAEAEVVASDLSMRSKENLQIARDSWFEIPAEEKGEGVFSRSFVEPTEIKGVEVRARNLESYSVLWQGSRDKGVTWTGEWVEDPSVLGEVDAVKVKISFEAKVAGASIEEVSVKEGQGFSEEER